MMKMHVRKKTNCIIFRLFDYHYLCLYPINIKVLQLFFKRHLCPIDKSTLLANVQLSCRLLHYSGRIVDVENLGLIQALKNDEMHVTQENQLLYLLTIGLLFLMSLSHQLESIAAFLEASFVLYR